MKHFIVLVIICCLIFPFVLFSYPKEWQKTIDEIKEEQKLLLELELQISELRKLALKKIEMKKLVVSGDYEKIDKEFLKDVKPLDIALLDDDLKRINEAYEPVRLIYGKIDHLEEYFLYYKGHIAYKALSTEKAINYLEKMLTSYSTSSYSEKANELLQEIYIKNGYDNEFLTIYTRHSSEKQNNQLFWYGQANYNLNNYREAELTFTKLKTDKEFGLRADIMLALIKLELSSIQDALSDLLKIKESYSDKEPFYEVVYLTLARILQLDGNNQGAIEAYSDYSNLLDKEADDEILFEMALLYREEGKIDAAEESLEKIITNPQKSEYFTSSKYLYAVILQEQGRLDLAEENVSMIINQTNELLILLNKKYTLIGEIDKILNEKFYIKDELKQKDLEYKQLNLERQLDETKQKIEKISTGLPKQDLEFLQQLEDEYLVYNKAVNEMQVNIILLEKNPNYLKAAEIENEIAIIDSERVRLQAISYLSRLKAITIDDYQLATYLAHEKFNCEKQAILWKQVENRANISGDKNVVLKAIEAQQMINDNLISIETITLFRFGEDIDNSDIKNKLQMEADLLITKQNDLRLLKQDVLENYNKKIAQKEKKEMEILKEEKQQLHLKYKELLSSIENEAKNQNQKYEFTLLDILFKQSKVIDENYENLLNESD